MGFGDLGFRVRSSGLRDNNRVEVCRENLKGYNNAGKMHKKTGNYHVTIGHVRDTDIYGPLKSPQTAIVG